MKRRFLFGSAKDLDEHTLKSYHDALTTLANNDIKNKYGVHYQFATLGSSEAYLRGAFSEEVLTEAGLKSNAAPAEFGSEQLNKVPYWKQLFNTAMNRHPTG